MHGYFRKLRVKGNIVTDGNVTATTGSVTAKTLSVTNTATITGGTGGLTAQTVTGTSNVVANKGFKEGAVETRTTIAQAVLLTYGVSLIGASTAGTSATRAFTLGPPPAAGVRKTIILQQSLSSTRVISVATTAAHYNSTRKSFQTVTGKLRTAGQLAAWELVGVSTAVWAVISSPGAALVSSTIGASSWLTYS